MAFVGEKNQEHGWGRSGLLPCPGSPRQEIVLVFGIELQAQASRCLRLRMTVICESSPWCSVSVGQKWAHPQRTLVRCLDLPPFLNSSLPDCSEWLIRLVGKGRGCILLPPPPLCFCFPSFAKGSSLVLGASHLEGLRLFGANVQVGSILRAPGQSSWGGVDGRYHTAPCGLWCS